MKRVFLILLPLLMGCAREVANTPIRGYKTYINTEFDFTASYPEGAKATYEKLADKIGRFSFSAGDEDVAIIMGTVDGDTDYRKLPELVPTILKVGNVISRETNLFRTTIEYDIGPGGYYSRAVTDSREGNFYIIASFNKANSFGVYRDVVDSFRITKSFSIFSIINIFGFVSLLMHIVALNYLCFDRSLKEAGRRFLARAFKAGAFWWHTFVVLMFVLADIFIVQRLYSVLFPFNLNGLYVMTVQLTPFVFNLAGEMISQGIAYFLGFGMWPGGSLGVVLTTIVSCIVNGFEVPMVAKKALAGLRKA